MFDFIERLITSKSSGSVILFILFFLLFFIYFGSCRLINLDNYKDDDRDIEELWRNLSLLQLIEINNLNRDNIFVNHDYSFSIKRDKTIGSESFNQCIDIYKLNSLDPNRIITEYDSFEKVSRCGSQDTIYIRCIALATIYVEVENYINVGRDRLDGNLSAISEDCRDIEKGVLAF
jgi:hypothetical protein